MFKVQLFAGDVCYRAADFTLIGRIPVVFERSYRSSLDRAGALGFGWSWSWAVSIRAADGGFVLDLDSGSSQETFVKKDDTLPHLYVSTSGSLLREDTQSIVVKRPDGFFYRFPHPGRSARAEFVQAIEDRWQNRLNIENDVFGPVLIEDVEKRRLAFRYDRLARVVSVSLDRAARSTPSTLVMYEYDGDDLVAVIDRCGTRFTYQYSDHLLTALGNGVGGEVLRRVQIRHAAA